MAGCDRDAVESNPEPGGRALHRMRPRRGEIDDPPTTIAQVVSRPAAPNCAGVDPGRCLLWVTSYREPVQQILKTDALLFDHLGGADQK